MRKLNQKLEAIVPHGRILIVTLKLEVGGTERHLLQILPRLNRGQFEIEVLTLYRGGEIEQRLRAHGVKVVTPWARLHPVAFFESAIRLAGKMHRQPDTVFHFWLPQPYLLGGVCSLLFGKRRMIMSRRSLNLYQKHHPILARLERVLHRRMAIVLGNSDAIKHDLIAEGIPQRRIRIIKNGIDLDRFKPTRTRENLRDELGIEPDDCVVICIANLISYKGHKDLLDALAIARNQIGTNWRLLCVGRDDGIRASLEAQAGRLKIDNNIMFLGSRQDVPDLLQASDIKVLASHQEGFSNAITEAMAMGLPTIATAVGGNSDAISHNNTGLLTPVRDPARLADAIRCLVLDPALRKSLGCAAQRDVRKNLTLSACVAEYEKVYTYVAA